VACGPSDWRRAFHAQLAAGCLGHHNTARTVARIPGRALATPGSRTPIRRQFTTGRRVPGLL